MEAIYLENCQVGLTFKSRSYHLSEEEAISFAEKYDPQPFHLDKQAAEDSFFKQLCASGWLVTAIMMKLMVESIPFKHGDIGAGVTLNWTKPVYPGDDLHIEGEITDFKPSKSKSDRGIAYVSVKVINQENDVVLENESKVVVFSKDKDFSK
ncbi:MULTISPECIES: MaoC family dehydratase [Aerococcus]|uniref:MaoC family dehydratase n=1 Tax=Aerococcus tenax TaxID=3078812 RepID=A0A5N1BW92_9LACT|nr:MaoC family dehydratase [Aerococcus urinae]KAA9242662.1 MaoC family dehydratase [Aerococcus urinae]MDK6370848.1 MaoC family dehydratase [Aerococcus urinae]MDK6597219.1 MaoC family dehydratase [Aerococcus urinae]MDK7301944.1 MaoC family dehydratase [Aerococcus urinae]MDK7801105.1 MaoC family dehydratase [Aerococcus urinae]